MIFWWKRSSWKCSSRFESRGSSHFFFLFRMSLSYYVLCKLLLGLWLASTFGFEMTIAGACRTPRSMDKGPRCGVLSLPRAHRSIGWQILPPKRTSRMAYSWLKSSHTIWWQWTSLSVGQVLSFCYVVISEPSEALSSSRCRSWELEREQTRAKGERVNCQGILEW